MADRIMQTAYPYLLTIAVPTYNRASCLDLCLSRVCPQLAGCEKTVELLVSDNCSQDATGTVVQKYIALGYPLTYVKNSENIGPDGNFVACYRKAGGKYLLILGDDDVLLDGAIATLLPILESGNYGIVFLSSYGFANDFERERPLRAPSGHTVFTDRLAFVKKVAHFFTFTSANIVNRALVEEPSDWSPFFDSNLVQLAWIFSALFKGEKHVYVSELLLAACIYNSGGYGICRVFGHNFNRIFDIFRKRGVSERYFRAINRKLLVEHFPAMIALARNGVMPFKPERYFRSLYPLYRTYPFFWLFTVPVILFPARPVYWLFCIAEKLLRQRWLAFEARQASRSKPNL
jgi:glycosyltransferase involved in cell wall biosynthesis